jgi:hypothetical protein
VPKERLIVPEERSAVPDERLDVPDGPQTLPRRTPSPAGAGGWGEVESPSHPAAQPHLHRRMTPPSPGGGFVPQGGRAPSDPAGRGSVQ